MSQLINQLCDDESAWQKPFADMMPASQRAIRERVNATGAPIPEGLLHECNSSSRDKRQYKAVTASTLIAL